MIQPQLGIFVQEHYAPLLPGGADTAVNQVGKKWLIPPLHVKQTTQTMALVAENTGTLCYLQFNQLEDAQQDLWLAILFVASLYESRSISKGWDPIGETLSNPST